MKDLIKVLAITFLISSCGGKSTTPSSGDDTSLMEKAKNFLSEESDTELTEAAMNVDVATSLSDVNGCTKIEESEIAYESSMKEAFTDLFTKGGSNEAVRDVNQLRLENLARIRGSELGASRVRLLGEFDASMIKNPTQRVAYYKCP